MQRHFIKYLVATAGLILLFSAGKAEAHVTVKPNQVGAASFQTFSVGVPSEKDIPTVGLRLVIPEGLKSVTPNVKPGWKIDEKKEGEGEEATVIEISWSEGSIPAGQRDDFVFSAQVPATSGSLKWKAYQTYQDGTVVSWDQDPATITKGEEGTPFSTTTIVNDLTSKDMGRNSLSSIAIILSLLALTLQFPRKK